MTRTHAYTSGCESAASGLITTPAEVSIDPNALRSSLPVSGVFGFSIDARDSSGFPCLSTIRVLEANYPNLSLVVDAAAALPLCAVEPEDCCRDSVYAL